MTIDHPEVWRCLQIKSDFFKTNLVEVILSYFIIFNIYILYPHYPLKSITLPGLEETGPVAPPNTTSTAPNLSRFSQCLGQWRPSRRQKYLPEITQVFWVHPFCLVFSNTYIHYKYKYTYTIIYICISSVTGCQASSRLRKEIKVARTACKGWWIIFGIPVWWETPQQENDMMTWLPGTTCHSKWPKWMVSSLSKQPFADPFADSSYPVIPKKNQKPWDFCYFFLSIFAICRMVKIGFTGSPRP